MANIWQNAVITNKGLELQAKTLIGETITITSVKAGAGSVAESELASLTAMTDIKQILTMQEIQTGADEYTAIIPVVLDNNGLTEAYDLRQVGFFVEDAEDGEVLYAIAQCSETKHIPSESEMPSYSLIWNFHFSLSNEINMSVTVDPAGMVTNQQLANALGNKMDKVNPTGTGAFSMNRKAGSTEGAYSSTVGFDASAEEDYAFAAGYKTTALYNQFAIGHFNDKTKSTANTNTGTTNGTVFVIGNGTEDAASNAFRVTGKGQPLGKLAYGATGADVAELREWLDGNPDNEDRRGYFVTMDGMNIKKAEPGDYICGVISGNPCLIGNADEDWMGRYVFDEFGAFVYEDVEVIDSKTGESSIVSRYKMNPEYDPSKPYVQRQDRPEWDFVGLCGVINTRDDGTCEINGFCKCGEGGIATKADRGYRVLERVNENIVKILFFLTGEIF